MDIFRNSGAGAAAFVEVASNLELLTAGIVRAATQPRNAELGEREFSPRALNAAVELPHHGDLKPEYQGMYVRYDSACANQHWGTEATVTMAINVAYNWWKQGYQPTMLLGDLSARNFGATGCHSAHKTGTHLDIDLPSTLPRDPGYNLEKQQKCAIVLWFAIQLGVRRALFSDSEVAQAVNDVAAEKGFPGRVEVRADHDNHFHLEMPL